MTIDEYRSKLQGDLQRAAKEEDYSKCRELVGILELLYGLLPEAPARFLTFTEIVQILDVGSELAEELEKKCRIPAGESFRVMFKFFALEEAYKMRGEKKTLDAIAQMIRSAYPARPVSSRKVIGSSVVTIGEYRTKITKDLKRITAAKNRWRAEDFSALLEVIRHAKDDAPAHFLTFRDIVQVWIAGSELAQDLYKKGEITSGQRGQVILRFFALAEAFALRDNPMPPEKISTAVQWQLRKQGWL